LTLQLLDFNPDTEKYYSIGKVGSGITDEMFEVILKDLKGLEISEKPENYEVEKMLHPDVWLKSKIVIEIDADEITRSPAHTAARGITAKVKKDDATRGLSVRFPRIKIWNRDKDLPNTVSELVRMYELRKG
jgi:DNA ligase 1